ncbi:MAG: hypothetical protein ACT4OO_07310 [Nitrospiraceae bacterium]
MRHHIKSADELAWLLTHTQGFRNGYVTDIHVSKRRLFDEASRRDVLAGTMVTTMIRYQVRGVMRVAKLTMSGVTDFSIFEQEGADCSRLDVIQAEASGDWLRFWFDPQGELYVVCEEADVEEVSTPLIEARQTDRMAQWIFQAETPNGPSVEWLLAQLDHAGFPCSWRAMTAQRAGHPSIQREGDLIPAGDEGAAQTKSVHVMVYEGLDGPGFGIVLRLIGNPDRSTGRVLGLLADLIAQRFAGQCLVGNTIIPGTGWLSWKAIESGDSADV